MPRKNYFYINGKGRTAVVWFVDADRRVSVVASDPIWAGICGPTPVQGKLLGVGHLVQ